MQDLTPVGLSKDGKSLVLVSTSGEEYAVPVDHRLRSALRGDTARLGQLEMKMESALRPRDIQKRIRAGESTDAVAAAAQTSVEAIMPYAGPVLAERAHIAQSAQTASVRRKATEAPTTHRTLDDVARDHFSGTDLHAEDLAWDAWRRDDGRWTLVAEFTLTSTPRQAQFTFDLAGRYVIAENDDARRITGELESAAALGNRAATAPRRLTAVPSNDDELPLGDDAIELVREHPDDSSDPMTHAVVEHTEDLGDLENLGTDPTADHADADWIAATPENDFGPVDGAAPVDEPVHGDQLHEDGLTEEPAKPKKKGRSSVPSWDEIMFGGGKSD